MKMDNGMPVHSPKYCEKIKPILDTKIKKLYFCGDYLGGPSLEAAVASGIKVAKEVLND